MRIAIISDLHSNAPALDAVLLHAAGQGAPHTLCLGDIVGYHALPHETIARMRDRQVLSVAGNHDLAVTGALSISGAGPLARRAVAWTRATLDDDDLEYLRQLPPTLCHGRRLLCVHAALDDPERRLERDEDYREATAVIRRRYPAVDICLTGHTHEQSLVSVAANGAVTRSTRTDASITPGAINFVNPGSVGRPLDGDRRAAYAILDLTTGAVGFWRVAYDTSLIEEPDHRAGLFDTAPVSTIGRWISALAQSMQEAGAA